MDCGRTAGTAEAVVTIPVGELVSCDRRKQAVLGAVGLAPHGADTFELISLRNLIVRNIIPEQEKRAAVHCEQECILFVLSELFHSGKAQIASSFLIKPLFIIIFARHADLAMLAGLVNVLRLCVFFALNNQKVSPAETINRTLRNRIGLFRILIVQRVRVNVLKHHSKNILQILCKPVIRN